MYTYAKTGSYNIEHMKQLAASGRGLNSFIKTTVDKAYVLPQMNNLHFVGDNFCRLIFLLSSLVFESENSEVGFRAFWGGYSS